MAKLTKAGCIWLTAAMLACVLPPSAAQPRPQDYDREVDAAWKSAARQAVDAKRYDEAVRILDRPARQGLAEAQLIMGALLTEHLGEHRSALEWLQLAAQQGDKKANLVIGMILEEGRTGAPDPQLALDWYLPAARASVQGAAASISRLYVLGKVTGVPDYGTALYWSAREAGTGNPAGTRLLTLVHTELTRRCEPMRASANPSNPQHREAVARECLSWFEADLKRPATAELCTEATKMAMADLNRAKFLLTKGVAEANLKGCAYGLGMLAYLTKYFREARRHLSAPALAGDADSQLLLSYAYLEGDPVDRARGEFWLGTAALSGNSNAIEACRARGMDFRSSTFGLTLANLARLGYRR